MWEQEETEFICTLSETFAFLRDSASHLAFMHESENTETPPNQENNKPAKHSAYNLVIHIFCRRVTQRLNTDSTIWQVAKGYDTNQHISAIHITFGHRFT